MLHLLDHPLVKRDVSLLREKSTSPSQFRTAMHRIGIALAFEAARHAELNTVRIQTPLEETDGYTLAEDLVLLPVLRSGVALVPAFSDAMPEARIAYIGLARNEETLKTHEYYLNIPPLSQKSLVYILDPMLATGGSMCATLERVQKIGAKRVVVVSVIAAPEGVERVETAFPNVPILTAALDRGLNEHGFIVPGLGDAGDRYHGTV